MNNLHLLMQQNNLDLEEGLTEDSRLYVEHNQYGAEPNFGVVIFTEGILANEANTLVEAVQGRDVQGTIGGVKSIPQLDAMENPVLGPDGKPVPPENIPEGVVHVTNNALTFQIGPNQGKTASVSLRSVNTRILSRGVKNESGYTPY